MAPANDWITSSKIPAVFAINSMRFEENYDNFQIFAKNSCSCSKTDILNPEAQGKWNTR